MADVIEKLITYILDLLDYRPLSYFTSELHGELSLLILTVLIIWPVPRLIVEECLNGHNYYTSTTLVKNPGFRQTMIYSRGIFCR